jgi:hypothetical protein
MKDSKIFKLVDLIGDIKKVDEMINLHKQDGDADFMLSQYEAKKTKLTGYLISELNTPPFKSTSGILFIKQFLDKYYTDSSILPENSDFSLNDLRKLEAAL